MNFQETLFRCSSLGYLMTESRSKSYPLSETTKTHLIDVFVSNKYGRNNDISNRYVEKGLMVEEDSITLYSRVKKVFHKKNDLHLANDFIKGTPDLFEGKSIGEAEIIIDIKSSWDIYTFFRIHTQPLNKMYYWQLQGYMALTGAKKAKLVYCLVNTPEVLINDEKRKLLWKMGVVSEEDSNYQNACEEIDKAMRFDDIPMKDRVIEIEVNRDDEAIDSLYKRVADCRNYLTALEEKLCPSVVLASYNYDLKTTICE